MTPALTPPPAKDVGLKSLREILDNRDTAFEAIKSVLPVFVVSSMAGTFAGVANQGDNKAVGLSLVALITALAAGWAWPHIAIRWHRFVIAEGHMDYKATWLSPDSTYVRFVLKGLIPIGAIFAGLLMGGLLALALPAPAGAFLMLISFGVGIYAGTRLMFLLPAVALEHDITIGQAWTLGRGMVWKVIWAPIRATWHYLLAYLLYVFVITFILHAMFVGADETAHIPALPLFIFRTLPDVAVNVFYVLLGLGVVSNYYKWLLQSVGVKERDAQ
jgi:hypothetical protein